MNVASYTFQSPYSSQVQVGRLDPSSKQDSDAKETDTEIINNNSSASKAQNSQQVQTSEVKPTVDSAQLLDTYV